MVAPIIAAIFLAGAASTGPAIFEMGCGCDGGEGASSREDKEAVESTKRSMKRKRRPTHLKCQQRSRLYSLPTGVAYVEPDSLLFKLQKWAKGVIEALEPKSTKLKTVASDVALRACSKRKLSDLDNICYICCDAMADAVFLDCGHGGSCLDCALQICALAAECPMCRGEVAQVLQVELLPAGSDKLVRVIGP